MQDDALDEIECKPLFIVQLKGRRGACSIAFEDPARALKSVADLLAHGFHQVSICDAAGKPMKLEDVKLLSGQ